MSDQGNYRAITAADMGEMYSRNVAQQQLYVSKFPPENRLKEIKNAEHLLAVDNIPGFEETEIKKIPKKWSKEVNGKNQGDGL